MVLFSGIIGNCDMAVLPFVVLSRCRKLWGADRLLWMAKTGSLDSDFVRDGPGGVAALNVVWFLSSGFVRLNDVAMDILGTILVMMGSVTWLWMQFQLSVGSMMWQQ
jgi:hypothetical protein